MILKLAPMRRASLMAITVLISAVCAPLDISAQSVPALADHERALSVLAERIGQTKSALNKAVREEAEAIAVLTKAETASAAAYKTYIAALAADDRAVATAQKAYKAANDARKEASKRMDKADRAWPWRQKPPGYKYEERLTPEDQAKRDERDAAVKAFKAARAAEDAAASRTYVIPNTATAAMTAWLKTESPIGPAEAALRAAQYDVARFYEAYMIALQSMPPARAERVEFSIGKTVRYAAEWREIKRNPLDLRVADAIAEMQDRIAELEPEVAKRRKLRKGIVDKYPALTAKITSKTNEQISNIYAAVWGPAAVEAGFVIAEVVVSGGALTASRKAKDIIVREGLKKVGSVGAGKLIGGALTYEADWNRKAIEAAKAKTGNEDITTAIGDKAEVLTTTGVEALLEYRLPVPTGPTVPVTLIKPKPAAIGKAFTKISKVITPDVILAVGSDYAKQAVATYFRGKATAAEEEVIRTMYQLSALDQTLLRMRKSDRVLEHELTQLRAALAVLQGRGTMDARAAKLHLEEDLGASSADAGEEMMVKLRFNRPVRPPTVTVNIDGKPIAIAMKKFGPSGLDWQGKAPLPDVRSDAVAKLIITHNPLNKQDLFDGDPSTPARLTASFEATWIGLEAVDDNHAFSITGFAPNLTGLWEDGTILIEHADDRLTATLLVRDPRFRHNPGDEIFSGTVADSVLEGEMFLAAPRTSSELCTGLKIDFTANIDGTGRKVSGLRPNWRFRELRDGAACEEMGDGNVNFAIFRDRGNDLTPAQIAALKRAAKAGADRSRSDTARGPKGPVEAVHACDGRSAEGALAPAFGFAPTMGRANRTQDQGNTQAEWAAFKAGATDPRVFGEGNYDITVGGGKGPSHIRVVASKGRYFACTDVDGGYCREELLSNPKAHWSLNVFFPNQVLSRGAQKFKFSGGAYEVEWPDFYRGHWGADSKGVATGQSAMLGRWNYSDDGGSERWTRSVSTVEQIELRANTGAVRGAVGEDLGILTNSSGTTGVRGNLNSFTMILHGRNLWGSRLIWTPRGNGIDFGRVNRTCAGGKDVGWNECPSETPTAALKYRVTIHPEARSGWKHFVFEDQELKFYLGLTDSKACK